MLKQRISLKARALRYLSMREHSRAELARKLARYADESDDVPALLDALEAASFLSAERFSDSLVNRRQARFGNQRIFAELRSHGLDEDQIDAVKTGLLESEEHRASEVLLRKFARAATDQQDRIKQMRFLQQRGFSGKAIQIALRTAHLDNPETAAEDVEFIPECKKISR